MHHKLRSAWLVIYVFSVALSKCPENITNLHRIGTSRYFIIQNTQKRGDFVTIEQAQDNCKKHGLKLATIKDMLSLAVVGRQLEYLVFMEKLKDTWYWLDAKYDNASQKYYWGDSKKDELKYTLFLYRRPRPIGVSSHITFNNVYQKEELKPQCLTLALPWLGRADHSNTTTEFFGHQTSFDEKYCKSRQKRHALCEAKNQECKTIESDPFLLDEDKHDYFDNGVWIFGDRKHLVNWKQRNVNESERYCKSLGLSLMTAGPLERLLIPHLKMWSRAITASQFWTGMSFNQKTKEYLDSSGNVLAVDMETNFTEDLNSRSSKHSPLFCVALSLAYEFLEQMPCSNPSSSGCQWSFIKYAPANCNNFHGTICQHENYDERNITWFPKFKSNLTEVLVSTAVTEEFGYKGNNQTIRSKYKQTFGLCYCPSGYRMIRSNNNTNIAWSVKPTDKKGMDLYEYDYLETYWVVDKNVYNKSMNSTCTLSYVDGNQRKFREVNCTEWHFYICERIGKRPRKPLKIKINLAPPMKWHDCKQPRIYPLLRPGDDDCFPYDKNPCQCAYHSARCAYNTANSQCVKRWKECPPDVFSNHFCQRQGPHIFYAIGGLICNSVSKNDHCTIEDKMYAVNMNGIETVDSRNISYLRNYDSTQPWVWVKKHDTTTRPYLGGVPSKDGYLYDHVFGGTDRLAQPLDRSKCSYLLFRTEGDGFYEISIKGGEHWHPTNSSQNRTFSVILNDVYIVNEYQVKRHRDNPLGVELVANFRIHQKSQMFELQGHTCKRIERTDRKMKLEICYSTCDQKYVDPNWSMVALSIVKFAP